MHLISWNVAGWKTTIDKIKQRHKSFDEWLKKHNIDILCLQEVKISSAELATHPKDFGGKLEGYDSFWACPSKSCVGDAPSKQRAGLNGIATFARCGTTRLTNTAPLGDPSLDSEGRCLFTDHGDFVLFNVYVPHSGPGNKRFPFKMRFVTTATL